MSSKRTIAIIWCFTALLCARAEVSFNRDIRPLLAERCLECHGPAKANAGLRLDSAIAATNTLKSGSIAVVPGDASKSELMRRLHASAGDDLMPPPDSGKPPLTSGQITLLKEWIQSGAQWDSHWAFEPIRRPAVPTPAFPDLVSNPIDGFIQKELAAQKLRPSQKASERILDRRLAFDLTGLPPTPTSASWEEKIDAHLNSPAFGERMAVWWLDLVRYADTEGYFFDSHRNVYPYRDYVIAAFNANKPFDQFTREQLAGDLLPNAAWEQKVASGYNRLILTTHETGANEAEYRARYAGDRVRNLGSVWLGLTLGCAQCHDHKFDPISAADFYRVSAFFADIKEEAIRPQPEIFVNIDDPEYRALVRKTEDLLRIQDAGLPEVECAEIVAEDEFRQTGRAPDNWPKSKKTKEVTELLRKKVAGAANSEEIAEFSRYFRRHFNGNIHAQLARTAKARQKWERAGHPSLISEKGAPQTVRILPRGDWMDQSGPRVRAGFPEFLKAPTRDNLLDRADLAEWMVSKENPLTARVVANRLWQLFFGEGIVRTVEDFGIQGEAPSNPDLLDYLASELIDSGWNIKHLVRLIVTSHTYQQTSGSAPLTDDIDPDNRLFARQNRFSLPAEFVRDNVRAISGLLSRGQQGPPVRSYLPAEDLEAIQLYDDDKYITDQGERLHRRGLYMYRKRSFLHPTLAAFDASTREECASQRSKTQSPRQALALLNAPAFVECARVFAERIHDSACDDSVRIKNAFQFALNRDPSEKERSILLALLEEQRKSFAADPISAAKFIRTGHYRWPKHMEAHELAAWTDVARAILNLEETNTRY